MNIVINPIQGTVESNKAQMLLEFRSKCMDTSFNVPKTIHQQLNELPPWINRQALLRKLPGDAYRIKFQTLHGRRQNKNSRSKEVAEILEKKLPKISKSCDRIEKILSTTDS